ncbi:bifunctional hydroxymethylpyrimidine kinase/phosphomethylpyrimidine kinase [uncultured Bacteroides sp.]|jgi:phosphomethylpyrimidine kinase|uniref:bifunctional hydroxymethylpyrimidine kinase/phosphomethylpyrimidine kinase n=1 Tax=uncultured Bacteroides sp. TaxID=162156 RepID=UPI00280BC25F|nr:bifunctional hydroxymethylpyrimidine kinase/phosphomethylpyrimidine kinase [uncultured Bacteroides sp.]
MFTLPIILTIAGSDCSGGAGIQADIKTISALKGYAASVITAVTAQNTMGVQAVYPVPADVVRAQIEAVMDDLQPVAVKIGMVYDAAIAHAIAECMQKYRPGFIVYDPVMVSTSGRRLMTEDTVRIIREELFPLCSLITPNLCEASLLLSHSITDVEGMKQAACSLASRYHCAVLVKGGHLSGDEMCDVLYDNGNISLFGQQKVESRNLHGTGCTLSSAIATFVAIDTVATGNVAIDDTAINTVTADSVTIGNDTINDAVADNVTIGNDVTINDTVADSATISNDITINNTVFDNITIGNAAISNVTANHYGLEKAVRRAKAYISKAIVHGKDLRIGHGNGPLCHFFPDD